MDRRWQLVLDCLDCAEAPFSKGTLVAFRERLIAARPGPAPDRADGGAGARRPAALATGSCGRRWTAARCGARGGWKTRYNLLGHALRKALGMLARQQGRGLAAVAAGGGRAAGGRTAA